MYLTKKEQVIALQQQRIKAYEMLKGYTAHLYSKNHIAIMLKDDYSEFADEVADVTEQVTVINNLFNQISLINKKIKELEGNI